MHIKTGIIVINNKKPYILITNDDGYFAPGLHALIEMAKQLGELLVIAPEEGVSGMSHAITIKVPLRATKIEEGKDITFYKINGTPADCIKLGLNQLAKRKPDLILSGINHGANSSISIVYSGTMGGAIEGNLNDIPAIGLSVCSHSLEADLSLIKKHCFNLLQNAAKIGLPNNTCLNINFPDVTEKKFKGLKVCRQAKGIWKEEYEKRTDPHGGTYYWLTGAFHNQENGSTDTDEWALAHNYASIVPVSTDFTDYKSLVKLEHLNIELHDSK